jgi:hypothetical protein
MGRSVLPPTARRPMMVDERSAWLELRRRLNDVLGPEIAMTLMENLPGKEVATKATFGRSKSVSTSSWKRSRTSWPAPFTNG